MKQKLSMKRHRNFGFTIIEVMIVLAIAGLIMVLVFITASQSSANRRDSQRKAYARQVVEALEEFYKNNGRFPGCLTSCAGNTDRQRFLTNYMPDGTDASTGKSYNTASTSVSGDAVVSSNGAAAYYNNMVPHDTKPAFGQIYIATAHWCYSTAPDGGAGPPLAGTGTDSNLAVFAVVIYQEHGGYYCLDNYSPTR